MPLQTINYKFSAFLDSDLYSALLDYKRFITADNELYSLSDIIGDGIISGWEISSSGFPIISVSAGSGLVEGFYVSTENSQKFELEADKNYYVYVKIISDVPLSTGCYSRVSSVKYIDSTPPDQPTGLVVENDPLNSQVASGEMSVILDWDENISVDFSHFNIYRKTSSSDYVLINSTTLNKFTDTQLLEDTIYYYQITSVDYSGNESSPAAENITTPVTSFLPPNPNNISVLASNKIISVCWNLPSNISPLLISGYAVIYSKLDSDNSILSTDEIIVTDIFSTIPNLENGHKYSVTVKTIDSYNRRSTGITSVVVPSGAVLDPQNVSISVNSTETLITAKTLLTWTPPGDEYGINNNVKYRIYGQIQKYGTQESVPIETAIGVLSTDFRLLNFGTVAVPSVKNIPEDTVITVRITTVNLDGNESKGVIVRKYIPKYSPPQALRSTKIEFDFRKITASWGNNFDTYSVNLSVHKRNTEEPYDEWGLVSTENINNSNIYTIDKPDLGTTYRVSITPIDIHGNQGDTKNLIINIPSEDEMPSLPIVSGLISFARDGGIDLQWSTPLDENNIIDKIQIYRAEGETVLDPSEYELLDTLSRTISSYKDIGVDPEQEYSYFVIAVDVYGRESLSPRTGYYNADITTNTAEILSGIEPVEISTSLTGHTTLVEWVTPSGEPFVAFELYKSIDNRHNWTKLTTINFNENISDYSYEDTNITLADQQSVFYVIRKINNNSTILVSEDPNEDEALLIGLVNTDDGITTIDDSPRFIIKNLQDTLSEKTKLALLQHIHGGDLALDPDLINLDQSLIVSNWTTEDGKTWTTDTDISGGLIYDLTVNGTYPSVIYNIIESDGRIVFAEPISETSEVVLKVIGISEVEGILDSDKIEELHAAQLTLGRLTTDNLPSIDHNGITKAKLYPLRNELSKYDNHSCLGETTEFGNANTLFSITDKSSTVETIQNFDSSDIGTQVLFNLPQSDEYTSENILNGNSEVSIEQCFNGDRSYKVTIKFTDDSPSRWVKLNTESFNPVINLDKNLGMRIMVMSGSFKLGLGVRKAANNTTVGSDGGIINSFGNVGDIEFVGVSDVLDYGEKLTPVGIHLLEESPGFWRDINFDLSENVLPFTGDGTLKTDNGYATIEHLAITINSDSETPDKEIIFYIDQIEQRSDTLAAGSSEGLVKSTDYGRSWNRVRYTETPIHRFFKASINGYLWGISTKRVYYSSSADQWFEVPGIRSVQYIYDLIEDEDGDMYASTDKGVFILRTNTYSSFFEMTPVRHVSPLSSSVFAIWRENSYIYASTSYGIYRTNNKGESWTLTSLLEGENTDPIYQVKFIGNDFLCISNSSVYRKLSTESEFVKLNDLTESFEEITNIWKIEIFDGKAYISTNDGVYVNTSDLFSDEKCTFDRVFPATEINGIPQVAFELATVSDNENLFLCFDNRVYIYDKITLSILVDYPNRQKPTFFIDNSEIKCCYTYNTFNFIVSFRDPFNINSFVEAEIIPRTRYSLEYGWAHRNIDSDVLIYRNGVPEFIDFSIDQNSVLSAAQSAIVLFPDNASLVESANVLLNGKVNRNANGEIVGTEPLITSRTVRQFLNDYSFSIKTNTNMPVLYLNGTTSDNREPKTIEIYKNIKVSDLPYTSTINELISFENFTKAFNGGYLESTLRSLLTENEDSDSYELYLLAVNKVIDKLNEKTTYTIDTVTEIESELSFTAKPATGIKIDAVHGVFDFTDYLNTNKVKFTKDDTLLVSIFGSSIANIGVNSHDQLEDKMEHVNSGMDSGLTDVATGNFIKNGVLLDKYFDFSNHETTQRIQSFFASSEKENWYDKTNSTVDYNLVSSSENMPITNMVFCTKWFDNDPYFSNILWTGTDVGIVEFTLDQNTLVFSRFININNEQVTSIVEFVDTIIVSTTRSIYETQDYGSSWTEYNTSNLPDNINGIIILSGNMVVSTSNRVWWSNGTFDTFSQSFSTSSERLAGQNKIDAEVAFVSNITNITSNNFVIVESNKQFYISNNGISFFAIGDIVQADVVSDILFYKNLLWVTTEKGLYTDSGTVFSDKIQFSLLKTSDTFTESQIGFTDIINFNSTLYTADEFGYLYRYDGEWKRMKTPFDNIHKIQPLNDELVVVFSYNQGSIITVSKFDDTDTTVDPVDIIDIEACTENV